jgi:hypothetical protein
MSGEITGSFRPFPYVHGAHFLGVDTVVAAIEVAIGDDMPKYSQEECSTMLTKVLKSVELLKFAQDFGIVVGMDATLDLDGHDLQFRTHQTPRS